MWSMLVLVLLIAAAASGGPNANAQRDNAVARTDTSGQAAATAGSQRPSAQVGSIGGLMKPASADGRGIKIVYVVKGGPADTVGLIPGDLITAANDTPVRTPNDLVKIIRSSIPGMTITISYLHEGAQKQTAITVLGRDKVDGSYRKAAEQGDANAQNNVGAMYANGKGVPQDYAQAMRWYRKATEQGDAAAEYGVGRMYANGNGVPQDYAQAIGWFRKAAEQGAQTRSMHWVSCTPTVTVFRRTTLKPWGGSARRPSRGTQPRRIS